MIPSLPLMAFSHHAAVSGGFVTNSFVIYVPHVLIGALFVIAIQLAATKAPTEPTTGAAVAAAPKSK
jgi:hypothetical protein